MKNFKLISKLYELVDKEFYLSHFILILLFILLALLETLSIGLILPLLSIILNENFKEEYSYFYSLFEYFNIVSPKSLLISCMSFLFLTYLIKNIISLYVTFYQASFSNNVASSLSKKIFSSYIYAPYSFHVSRNTSKLMRNLYAEVNQFNAGLICFIILIGDLIIVLFIFLLLLVIQMKSAIIVSSVLITAGAIYYYFSKKTIIRLGGERIIAEAKLYKIISHALLGIRDLILLQSHEHFKESHAQEMGKSMENQKKLSIFHSLPKLWIETISITAITLVVITFALQDYSFLKILSILGLFAAAGFRLLPAVNRILGNLQKLRFVSPVITNLHNEVKSAGGIENYKTHKISPKKQIFSKNIIFNNVSFFHKGSNADTEVFSNANFTINKGEIIGVLGKSGSGKSTLIDLLTGLITPTSGNIYFDDGNLISDKIDEWQSHIAYVSQNSFLIDGTIKSNIAFGVDNTLVDVHKIMNVIEDAGLSEHISELSEGIETLVGENGVKLSGGQKQRICIARYLYFNRDLLIFDESTSALDIETEKKIVETIKKLQINKTILIVSHRASALQACNKFISLEDKKLNYMNTYEEVLGKYPFLNKS